MARERAMTGDWTRNRRFQKYTHNSRVLEKPMVPGSSITGWAGTSLYHYLPPSLCRSSVYEDARVSFRAAVAARLMCPPYQVSHCSVAQSTFSPSSKPDSGLVCLAFTFSECSAGNCFYHNVSPCMSSFSSRTHTRSNHPLWLALLASTASGLRAKGSRS